MGAFIPRVAIIAVTLLSGTFLLGTAAFGDALQLQFDQIPKNTVVVYQRQDGSVFSHLYRGNSDPDYRIDMYRGNLESGPIKSLYYDQQGNTLAVVNADGSQVTYTPHNCERKLGRCAYKIRLPDGTIKHQTSINRKRGNYYCQETIFSHDGTMFETNERKSFGTYGIRTAEWDADEFCRPDSRGESIEMIQSYVKK